MSLIYTPVNKLTRQRNFVKVFDMKRWVIRVCEKKFFFFILPGQVSGTFSFFFLTSIKLFCSFVNGRVKAGKSNLLLKIFRKCNSESISPTFQTSFSNQFYFSAAVQISFHYFTPIWLQVQSIFFSTCKKRLWLKFSLSCFDFGARIHG